MKDVGGKLVETYEPPANYKYTPYLPANYKPISLAPEPNLKDVGDKPLKTHEFPSGLNQVPSNTPMFYPGMTQSQANGKQAHIETTQPPPIPPKPDLRNHPLLNRNQVHQGNNNLTSESGSAKVNPNVQDDPFKATKELDAKKNSLKNLRKSAGTAADERDNRNIRAQIDKVKKQISEFRENNRIALANESKLKRDNAYHADKAAQFYQDDMTRLDRLKSRYKDVKYQAGTAKDNAKLLKTVVTKENLKKRVNSATNALTDMLPTIEPRKKEKPSTPFFERVKKDFKDVFNGGYSKRRSGDTEGGYGPNRG